MKGEVKISIEDFERLRDLEKDFDKKVELKVEAQTTQIKNGLNIAFNLIRENDSLIFTNRRNDYLLHQFKAWAIDNLDQIPSIELRKFIHSFIIEP